ncbi:hypothetical protein QQ020_12885 [Fulvivirgaceae bacterium BMA12]|uniref:Aldose 1-epimerase n=1 Tax=Agaribacillus aureus TaxID=3051825 RepID=A0ABT8L5F2_9BACT|nr:hypothetical protein [Fulvivirgaceae bacterium BMA12]
MSFQIEDKLMDGLDVVEIKNLQTGEYVNIVPRYGGAINEVVLKKNNDLHPIHKAAKSLDAFNAVSIPLYAGTFLAPFPNRVANGRYEFNGTTYLLDHTDPGLPNALHGFLYKTPFKVSSPDQEAGRLALECSFHGDIGYPFKVFFRNTYQLSENELRIRSYACNESGTKIPFGMGWHPYIATGTPIDKLQLKIPGEKTFEQDTQYIPIGTIKNNPKFREYAAISNDFMNDCYQVNKPGRTSLYDPDKDLEIFIDQQTGPGGYNYCMYFTPPDRDCLAIEPMTAAPDAFNNGHGLITLAEGEAIELAFSLRINER